MKLLLAPILNVQRDDKRNQLHRDKRHNNHKERLRIDKRLTATHMRSSFEMCLAGFHNLVSQRAKYFFIEVINVD